jgi:hypothetical protein
MDRPPKATCQASKHYHHGEDPYPLQMSMCQKSGTSRPCLSPKSMMLSSKVDSFAPPGQIVWQVRVGLGCPSHHQGHPSLISLTWHAVLIHI